MATDKFKELKELTIKNPVGGIISFVASGIIPMWAPVIGVTPLTNDLPRVSVTTTANNALVIGVAVGGSGSPVKADGTTGNAADKAGDIVDVALIQSGVITKVKVLGTTNTFGAALETSTTSGAATKSTGTATPHYVLGKVWLPSTVTLDTTLIMMAGTF